MKKVYSFLTVMVSAIIFAQTTIYTENFGNPTATTLMPAYTGYQATAPVAYSGTADVRSSTPSTGYTGASGLGCAFFGAVTTINALPVKTATISGIVTTGFENLTLSLGHQKSTNASSNELIIEVSGDGTTWTQLSYSRPTGNSLWLLITPTGTIPESDNLRIRFTNPVDSNVGFRIDDLKLVGTPKALAVSNTQKTKFNVFPTVVNNGVFYITSENNAAKNVKVYDQSSKLVLNTTATKEVNVSKLTRGIYLISVEQNGAVETKKIIIK